MQKYFIRFIVLSLVIFSNTGWGKSEKTGVVDKTIFSDSRFNFQITTLDSWKIKTEKEPSILRVTFQPRNYLGSQGAVFSALEVTIPSFKIFVDTTSHSASEYKSLLLNQDKKLPNLKTYLKKMDFLSESTYELERKSLVDNQNSIQVTAKKRYLKTVRDPRERSSRSGTETLVEDFILGYLVFFKKGNEIYTVQFSAEREFFRIYDQEWQKMMESWKFLNEK